MHFEFATASRIVFGRGKLKELPELAEEFGTRAMIVTGKDSQRATPLLELFKNAGIESSMFCNPSEPTVDLVREAVGAARLSDIIVGFGGGSAIDAAKAIAAVAANSGEPLDYLEVVGRGRPLEKAPKPFIAVPTTAGTGAEVTRNAVLDSPEHGVKASLRHPSMLAKIALVDPELTFQLPPGITAATGMDTLTQLIEAYVSCRANPFTDLFCLEGIQRVTASLRTAFHNGSDPAARESMSFASLLSGLALANAGLGVVHGFAAPLGGLLHAAHGAICAAVLSAGMAANIRALRERAPNPKYLERYRKVAALLTGKPEAQPEDGVHWVTQLCADLQVKNLSALGLAPDQIGSLVEKAANASSMKGNPLPLTNQELMNVAEESL